MKTNNCTKYLIPLLFACGTCLLTTGVVAAVQQNETDTQPSQPAATTPHPAKADDAAASPQPDTAATPAMNGAETAHAFLVLLDQGKYGECHKQLAPFAKRRISPRSLSNRLKTHRRIDGTVTNRTCITDGKTQNTIWEWQKSRQNILAPYPMPSGTRYFFATSVSGQKNKLAETVDMSKQRDGSWKVTNYYMTSMPSSEQQIASQTSGKTDQPDTSAPSTAINPQNIEPSVQRTPQSGSQSENTAQAIDIALSWLTLIDEGKYTESYNQMDGFGKKTKTLDDWKNECTTLSKLFGKTIKRQWKKAKTCQTVDRLPDGTYMIITFETTTHGNTTLNISGNRTEKIILSQHPKTGSWSISGYTLGLSPGTGTQQNSHAQPDTALTPQKGQHDKPSQTIDIALSWLTLIDEGNYEKSYNQMDETVGKRNMTLSEWTDSCRELKRDFGIVTQRRWSSVEQCRAAPGLPDDSWITVTFRSETSAPQINKYLQAYIPANGSGSIPGAIAASDGTLIETVTLIKQQKDGTWRPAGKSVDCPAISRSVDPEKTAASSS